MNFGLNGNLWDKFYDIFENIGEKSNIDSINYACQGNTTGIEYLKTIVSDKTLFEKDDYCVIPSERTNYLCSMALQIQSVYHSTKDKVKM